MADEQGLTNRVRAAREDRGWSQEELARRSGLSRAAVSAIETVRVAPSTTAALSLARALSSRVEDLFFLGEPAEARVVRWAWQPRGEEARYWLAEIGGRTWRIPCEETAVGFLPHDGVAAAGEQRAADAPPMPGPTIVLAGCDPAVGVLSGLLEGGTPLRLLPLVRSSGKALELLRAGKVHAAGVHLSSPDAAGENAAAVRATLGEGYKLLRLFWWQAGLALDPSAGVKSIRGALRASLRWVGREEGSGARLCMDRLLGSARRAPRRIAPDHRAVAATIRMGYAQAGICVRLAAEEAGLSFLSVERQPYDICFPARSEGDPRLQALLSVVRSRRFRRQLAAFPGYETGETGEWIDA